MKNQKSNTETNGSANGTKDAGHKPNKSSLLEKFFVDQLKDIYYAEQHLVKALPEMQKAATSEELEDAFEEHLKQTERHVKRLEKVFQLNFRLKIKNNCLSLEDLLTDFLF